jgi:hypothetical protein
MRNGKDYDHFHPTCVNGVLTGTCLPAPFDGALLQIMPWPILQNLTDRDLLAIYEYLSAVPLAVGSTTRYGFKPSFPLPSSSWPNTASSSRLELSAGRA